MRKAAPVLIIALKVAQLALAMHGIRFPFPSLPRGMKQEDFLSKIFEHIDSECNKEVGKEIENDKEHRKEYKETKKALEKDNDMEKENDKKQLSVYKKMKKALGIAAEHGK